MTAKPLILVDGSSYFYRAFHALPPLLTTQGQPTGAIYGVINMIRRLLKEYDTPRVVVVLDAKGKTFRDELYPAYKAHRPPTPPDLSCQFEPMVALLRALGLPVLIIDGVEADDVIGTLAVEAFAQHVPVIISTGDKDMAQLVNEHVTLINTMSNQTLDVAGVEAKFGVTPAQIIDYLTLVGDTSDNIPGVKQCGPKTALKWLKEYPTLDNLVANASAITGKIGESLRASLDVIPLSKKLVTIKTDVLIPVHFDKLQIRPVDEAALRELYAQLEFKTWLKELDNKPPVVPAIGIAEAPDSPKVSIAYTLINTQSAFEAWVEQLLGCDLFCVDTETTGLDVMTAQLVGISMAIIEDKPVYIPLMHEDGSTQLQKAWVLDILKPILENADIRKVGQNLKYDYHIFKNEGITLRGIAFDSMLESYLLNSSAGRHDMDSLALKYLGYKTITFEELAGKGAKQRRFDQIPVNEAAPYAAEDADITLKLHHYFDSVLVPPLKSVLHTIEIPLLTVLAEMERHGVLINTTTLLHHGIRLKERLVTLEAEALALAGQPFNLNSPKQLQDILFIQHKLPVISKTPTGQPSTAESVLQELAYEYRLPAVILEYRSLSKLVSTYIEGLPKRVDPDTHRVHTSYNQAVTATGRLSSSDPNLQNIPIRSEEGRLIRRAFIAPEGQVLLSADYSQIELRIMAHLSQDPSLLKAFAEGWDVHAATASEIFQVSLSEVTSEQRRRAKAVNFGLIYGMSAFGLAKQIGVSRDEARHYIQCYFDRYPGVLAYMDGTKEKAREQGFVETLFGRRLYLPEIKSSNIMRQKAAERTAINAPMQGTAADIIKKAMISIHQWQNALDDAPVKMVMQVHDELVFEIEVGALEFCRDQIRHYMEHVVELAVPLKVGIGVGPNWDEAH